MIDLATVVSDFLTSTVGGIIGALPVCAFVYWWTGH